MKQLKNTKICFLISNKNFQQKQNFLILHPLTFKFTILQRLTLSYVEELTIGPSITTTSVGYYHN